MVYKFRNGFHVRGNLSAQDTGEFLEKIRGEQGGDLTADVVVDRARPKRSPIHGAFEWDDAVAAEEYRREQARFLIRSVVVTYEDQPDVPEDVRAFVCVRKEDNAESDRPNDKVYTGTLDAMNDPVMREQVVRQAIAEATAWQRRWRQFDELANVFRAINETKEKLVAEPASA